MTSVSELEADVAETRDRLNTTIGRIQDKLTVSGMVDEFMGQAGVPRYETGHDFVLGLLRRHPLPVMVAAAGLGFLVYSMNKRARGPALLSGREVVASELPIVAGSAVPAYDPDLSPRHSAADVIDTRRVQA